MGDLETGIDAERLCQIGPRTVEHVVCEVSRCMRVNSQIFGEIRNFNSLFTSFWRFSMLPGFGSSRALRHD